MPQLLEVALNGSRAAAEHPAIPRTAAELASAARAAVDAGAHILHLHAYDATGVPISLTTSAAIEPDPHRSDTSSSSRCTTATASPAGLSMSGRIARGHAIRTGLEDTTVLPDGMLAPDNAALVRAAAAMTRTSALIDMDQGTPSHSMDN